MATKKENGNNCGGYQQCPIEFLTELLEKLVDAQLAQSDNMSALKGHVSTCCEDIKWVKSQFTNGFRSEIKTHITQTAKDQNDVCEEIAQKIDTIIEETKSVNEKVQIYTKPSFWAKVIIAILLTTVTLAITAHSVYDIWHEHMATTQQKADVETRKYEELLKQSNVRGDKNGDSSTRPGK